MSTQIVEITLVAICSGVASGLGVFIVTALRPPRRCPECDESLPKYHRHPANRRQLIWGGQTCTHCGCELNYRGRRLSSATPA